MTKITSIYDSPLFPSSIIIDGASIKLFADGTWEGDVAAFEAALKEAKSTGGPFTVPISWLILNAIKRAS